MSENNSISTNVNVLSKEDGKFYKEVAPLLNAIKHLLVISDALRQVKHGKSDQLMKLTHNKLYELVFEPKIALLPERKDFGKTVEDLILEYIEDI